MPRELAVYVAHPRRERGSPSPSSSLPLGLVDEVHPSGSGSPDLPVEPEGTRQGFGGNYPMFTFQLEGTPSVSLKFNVLDSKRGLMLSLCGKDALKFQMKITKPFQLSAGIFTELHKG